jgi:hypothetical protein
MQLIAYPNDDGGVEVMWPLSVSVHSIAKKHVPIGKPYLIITDADLPDPQFRAAWEADFSEPDGYGIGYDAWLEEQKSEQTVD